MFSAATSYPVQSGYLCSPSVQQFGPCSTNPSPCYAPCPPAPCYVPCQPQVIRELYPVHVPCPVEVPVEIVKEIEVAPVVKQCVTLYLPRPEPSLCVVQYPREFYYMEPKAVEVKKQEVRAQVVARQIKTLTLKVTVGDDDCEQKLSSGKTSLHDDDLDLREGRSVGIRFRTKLIKPRDEVVGAQLNFTAKLDKSDRCLVDIYGERSANSANFERIIGCLSDRQKTQAKVSWEIPPWTPGSKHSSPDLSPIIQEILNLPGWEMNNSITFLMYGTSGHRSAWAFDGNPDLAPTLTIKIVQEATRVLASHESMEEQSSRRGSVLGAPGSGLERSPSFGGPAGRRRSGSPMMSDLQFPGGPPGHPSGGPPGRRLSDSLERSTSFGGPAGRRRSGSPMMSDFQFPPGAGAEQGGRPFAHDGYDAYGHRPARPHEGPQGDPWRLPGYAHPNQNYPPAPRHPQGGHLIYEDKYRYPRYNLAHEYLRPTRLERQIPESARALMPQACGQPPTVGQPVPYTPCGAFACAPPACGPCGVTCAPCGYQNAGSAACKLDAADGFIDGTYFGARILDSGPSDPAGGAMSAAQRLDAADGRMDGTFFGSRITVPGPTGPPVSANSAAQRLDAADGRMDGTFFGSKISTLGPTGPPVSANSAAQRLDAADGRMDGTFFGSKISTLGPGQPGAPYR